MKANDTDTRYGLIITRFPLECGWGGEEMLHADLGEGLRKEGFRVIYWTSDPAFRTGLEKRGLVTKQAFFVTDITSIYSLFLSWLWIPSLILQSVFLLPLLRIRGYRNILMLSFIEKTVISPIALLCGYRLYWAHHAPLGNWFFKNLFVLFWRFWSRFAVIIVPSMHLKKSFRHLAFRKDIRVIPNPIAMPSRKADRKEFYERHHISPHGLLIGYSGRLSPEKKLTEFIRFSQYYPSHTFLIAGEGEQRKDLEKQIELGNIKNCHLIGHLPQQELWDFYGCLDIFCLLSVEESFGIAAGEASAAGVPVIASAKSGTAEVIADRKTGLLFDPQKPDDARKKLTILLNDPDLRVNMGRAGRSRMRGFSFERYLKHMAELFLSEKRLTP